MTEERTSHRRHIAHTFGINADLDADYATFRLPHLLFTVVAGGTLLTTFQ